MPRGKGGGGGEIFSPERYTKRGAVFYNQGEWKTRKTEKKEALSLIQSALSQKRYLTLVPPTEEEPRSDLERVLSALAGEFGSVRAELSAMETLYPACRGLFATLAQD